MWKFYKISLNPESIRLVCDGDRTGWQDAGGTATGFDWVCHLNIRPGRFGCNPFVRKDLAFIMGEHSSNPSVAYNFFAISKDLTGHAPGTRKNKPNSGEACCK